MIYPKRQIMASTVGPFRQFTQFLALLWVIVPSGNLLAEVPDYGAAAQQFIADNDYAAAEQTLNRRLETYPEDLQARFLRARVFAWSGQYDASLADYDFLRTREPGNLDYVLGAARALLWAGRSDDAAILLEYERLLWAENEEIWELELKALATTDNPDSRRFAEELLQQALDLFPNSTWVEGFPAYFDRSNRRYGLLTAGFTYESLSNDRGNRTETRLAGAYHFDTSKVLYAGLRRTDHFGNRDTEVSLGGYYPFGEKWTANLRASISPDATVLPTSSVAARLHRKLPGDWGFALGVRHSEYDKTTSNVAAVSIERYWRNYRFVYRLSGGKADQAEATLSHELRGDYYYQADSVVTLSIADGTESERFGQTELITTDVTTLSLFGLHRLHPDWSVFWKFAYIRQGELYDSKGVGIEFHYQF